MDTNQRIRQLMKERGLTEYRLALDSGLSKSTVSALLHRNTTPSVPTIEAVCNALGITVSQFFAEEGDSLPVCSAMPSLPKHKSASSNRLCWSSCAKLYIVFDTVLCFSIVSAIHLKYRATSLYDFPTGK